MNHNNQQHAFHEIKNSVTIMECSLNLLAKAHPEVSSYEFWDTVMDEFHYLKLMMEVYSSNNQDNKSLQPYPLTSILSDVKKSILPLTKEGTFSFELQAQDKEIMIYTNRNKLKSCIMNLIKNAYEAMHKTGTVSISVTKEYPFVRMDITDRGCGISPVDAPHIFESGYTNKTRGTGLGLPITKQFISEMGGEIFFTSHLGEGSTFSMRLPIFIEDEHSV